MKILNKLPNRGISRITGTFASIPMYYYINIIAQQIYVIQFITLFLKQ